MSIVKVDNEKCCGCAACYDSCPICAISMLESAEGFLYPHVDVELCIECGKCEHICPALSASSQTMGKYLNAGGEPIHAYAVINRDEAVRKSSASGGVFSKLAEKVIETGGIVYGAGFAEDWSVAHMGISEKGDIEKLRSSKYAQSNTCGVFKQVEQNLKAAKKVLFSGTPCQVHALKQYLNYEYDNLICVDLFCHGISSPGLFRRYLSETIGDVKTVKSISFRDKTKSWETYMMRIDTQEKTYCKLFKCDPYLKAFCQCASLRNSCYSCKMKGFPRIGDITLGDFWMVDRIYPKMNDKKGISIVLHQTECGEKLLDECSAELVIKEIPQDRFIDMYSLSGRPVTKPTNRDAFFEKAMSDSIGSASKRYCKTVVKDELITNSRKLLIKLHIYDRLRAIKNGR